MIAGVYPNRGATADNAAANSGINGTHAATVMPSAPSSDDTPSNPMLAPPPSYDEAVTSSTFNVADDQVI